MKSFTSKVSSKLLLRNQITCCVQAGLPLTQKANNFRFTWVPKITNILGTWVPKIWNF